MAWLEQQPAEEHGRPESVKRLYQLLVTERGYTGSYRSVLRYLRRRRPAPAVRPIRRVETRPGAQGQIDWVLGPPVIVEELGGLVRLQAFVLTLSHSRMWAVVWSRTQNLLAWLMCPKRARVVAGHPGHPAGGQPQDGRSVGAGPWVELQDGYASYAKQLGFVINPCRVRQATDKGKVERRGRDVKWLMIRPEERFI